MEGVLGIILAGGQGKRMGVLCDERPKPILPFAGKFSVIDFTLSNCVNSQVARVAALTDYKRNQAAEYLKKWESANPGLINLSILPPGQNSYRGTADAVYQNLDWLKRSTEEKVLVLAGDHIYKMDYRKMLKFHNERQADVTVAVIRIPVEDAHRFGTVSVDDSGRIHNFAEKSANPLSNLASMGVYIFNKDVLMQRLEEDASRTDSIHDFGYAILPGIVNRDRVFAYEYDGYWQDIGTIKAYYDASMELLLPMPSFIPDDSHWPVFNCAHSSASLDVGKDGVVSNSLVSPGCVIKGRVENSILSPGVHVAEQAVIRNSIILSGVTIGYHSVVDRCILDEKVNIGKFCYLGFKGTSLSEKFDVSVLGKDAVVPPYTGIGRSCRIQPKVRPADFVSGLVSSGSLISSNGK